MIGAAMASRRKQVTLPSMQASGMKGTMADKAPHPTLAGVSEPVTRVADTILGMFKRKQLDEGEYMAGDKYRTAHQRLYSTMGGVMDFDRARGGGNSSLGPGDTYLVAAEIDSSVRKILYPKHFAIVYRVCALGMSIEEAAFNLPDQYERDSTDRPTRAAKEECGRRLRAGLSELADRWFPKNAGTGNRIRGVVHEKAIATDATEAPKASQVVHATGQKIYRTGGK
jgi:hypothetical protein